MIVIIVQSIVSKDSLPKSTYYVLSRTFDSEADKYADNKLYTTEPASVRP